MLTFNKASGSYEEALRIRDKISSTRSVANSFCLLDLNSASPMRNKTSLPLKKNRSITLNVSSNGIKPINSDKNQGVEMSEIGVPNESKC